MIFKTIPQNGASWQSPLLYNLEFEQREEQVEVEIYDQLTSESLGRIMLYNSSLAEIDIAPYIRSHRLSIPFAKQDSVIASSRDACRVVLRVNGEESEPRLLFRSDIIGLSPRLLSTATECGNISEGEVIRLTLLADKKVSLRVSNSSSKDVKRYESFTDGLPCEVALPVVHAQPGDDITLEVECDDISVGVCKYRVVERDSSAVRLVWVNSRGGVECYTFPQSVRRSLVVKSVDIEGECGWYRRVVGSTIVRRVMMSGVGQGELDGMLDILLSPKVARCDKGDDVSVQLLTDTITYDNHGRMHRLEFDIKEEWKGGVL